MIIQNSLDNTMYDPMKLQYDNMTPTINELCQVISVYLHM